ELAKSHNNLGIVLNVLGKSKDAVSEFQASRALLAPFAAGSLVSHQAGLAPTLNNLGIVQKTLGPGETAEQSLNDAHKLLRELTLKEPQVTGHRQELAQNHLLLGNLLRDTDSKTAEEHYRESIKLRQKLAGDFPNTPVYRQELAGGYSGLAILLQAMGQQKDAD